MYYYRIAKLTLQSEYKLDSFGAFTCSPAEPDIILEKTEECPPEGEDQYSGSVVHRSFPGGWFLHRHRETTCGLFVDTGYSHLRFLGVEGDVIAGLYEMFVRVALECRLAHMGFVTLHAAAVELEGGAYAFTGPSGVGKSTRADAWIKAFNTSLINGDRPLIDIRNQVLYGVPWDGKENCHRNVSYPLKMICEVRRSETAYVREMNFEQKRKLLLRQCFMPMWDTETATIQMINITRMASRLPMVRVFSGPTTEDARALKNALDKHHFLKEEPNMKAKPGFVLRNVVDEYILMPTGENIAKFNGTVLLNEVSAFVWEKLQTPLSRDDLLRAILDEFEVEKAVASKDLDALLEMLRSYNVIEDD